MTNNKTRPLVLLDAPWSYTFTELSISALGGVWVELDEGDEGPIRGRLSPRNVRRLRDWLTEYLGDATDDDKTSDDDGWEEVTDWENNPPRPGDEVRASLTVGSSTHAIQAIFSHTDEEDVVWSREGILLGRNHQDFWSWCVRRAPAPDPADVLTPGTIIRDAKTNGILRTTVAQVDDEADYAIGPWSGGSYEVPIEELGAFTVESTGDRWEKKDGRWTVTKKEHRND